MPNLDELLKKDVPDLNRRIFYILWDQDEIAMHRTCKLISLTIAA